MWNVKRYKNILSKCKEDDFEYNTFHYETMVNNILRENSKNIYKYFFLSLLIISFKHFFYNENVLGGGIIWLMLTILTIYFLFSSLYYITKDLIINKVVLKKTFNGEYLLLSMRNFLSKNYNEEFSFLLSRVNENSTDIEICSLFSYALKKNWIENK